MGGRLTPAERVTLERAAVLHGMQLRDPDAPAPMLSDAARVWTMDRAGAIAPRWRWPLEVDWWKAAGWRAEDQHGQALEDEAELELELED